jgi:hypothetical protein
MLIGETEYRYQVEEDIKPFRDVLLGLFFVSIGMRLDVPQIAWQWPLVARHPACVDGVQAGSSSARLFAPDGQFAGDGAAQRLVALRRRRIRLRHPGPQR